MLARPARYPAGSHSDSLIGDVTPVISPDTAPAASSRHTPAMSASRKKRQKKCPPPRKKRCMKERRSSSLPNTSSMPPNVKALETNATAATATAAPVSRLIPLTASLGVRSRNTPRSNRLSTDAASGE